MKIRVTFCESGTGESSLFDAEVKELGMAEVRRVMCEHLTEIGDAALITDSFDIKYIRTIYKGSSVDDAKASESAFVATSEAEGFGEILWTGIIYTQFVGKAEDFKSLADQPNCKY